MPIAPRCAPTKHRETTRSHAIPRPTPPPSSLLSRMASAKEISQYLNASRSSMRSASPWSRSAARCCVTISMRDLVAVVPAAGRADADRCPRAGRSSTMNSRSRHRQAHGRRPARDTPEAWRSCAECSRRQPETSRSAAGRRRACDLDHRRRVRGRLSRSRHSGLVGKVRASTSRRSRQPAGRLDPVIASLAKRPAARSSRQRRFRRQRTGQVLQPYKIIFLTGTGGLLGEDGKVIDSINLSTEYSTDGAAVVNGGMRVKIAQIKDCSTACRWRRRCRSRAPPILRRNCSRTRARARWCAAESACCAQRRGTTSTARLRTLIESSLAARW